MNRRRRKKIQRRLVAAAGWGTPRDVAALLRRGADPDLPDQDGTTPLYRASVQGRSFNVQTLLEAGADANRESGDFDEGLPLCAAVCHGHDEVAALLIAAGADPELREDGGTGLSASGWAAKLQTERHDDDQRPGAERRRGADH
ncbi:ankyrin repeat domain-containing protein [Actinoplanes couchii]|uniref:ankyrin repeat domain-containing protein n=1 Tax=Actinoplanes couchii TaxID=403638 RepID=UPI0019459891|nr:ankyrin repeat domain-containing protein [Actinoplanes couchii]MDR6319077.1 ankyrin repeat protein [Actinoplanes couchii]